MKKLLPMIGFRSDNATHSSLNTKSPLSANLAKSIETTRHNLLGFVCFFSLLAVSTQTMALNRIQTENALAGDPGWYEFYFQSNLHDLEGYADKDSVNIGETIKFFVSANPTVNATYNLKVYRLGWYNGIGARGMTAPVSRTSALQVIPTPAPVTGMVEANWTNPYTLTIPTTWTSGIYVVTLTGNNVSPQQGSYIPFVVRDKNRSSDYLFQSSTATWQAYNNWGGKSLYNFNSTGGIPARKVSFNRPYADTVGSGSLTEWEINMLFYMERVGYDVTYQSSTDTHTGDGGLLNHKAILSVGHDEYWSKAIRDNFEAAQKRGISLGFFGGNAAYWQVRMENSVGPFITPQNQQNRTIVGYKDFAAAEDPYATDLITGHKAQVTSRWRDPLWANRPENALLGIMYGFYPVNGNVISTRDDPYMVSGSSSHWAYTATDMLIGASFPGMLGYECDRIFDNGKTPANLEIVAASPIPITSLDDGKDDPKSTNFNPAAPKGHMTVYTKACSITPCVNPVSTVFATGSMQWVWGMDSYAKDSNFENPTVEQITNNVLARLINAPLPSEVPAASPVAAAMTITSASSATASFSSPPSGAAKPSFSKNQLMLDRANALRSRDNNFKSMQRGTRFMQILRKQHEDTRIAKEALRNNQPKKSFEGDG
jgi:hypothetical protein